MPNEGIEHRRKFLLGSLSNVTKGVLSVIVMLVLPPLLVRRLAPAEYSAWVLMLQWSAYVNLFDLSLQTTIGKFIAQYDSVGDRDECGRILSTAFALLCASALLGIVAVAAATWWVPQLFAQVPQAVIGTLRQGLFLVGVSTAIALPSNAFVAAFAGFQDYGMPTLLWIGNSIFSTIALVSVVLLHGSLLQLALVVALFNLGIGIARYFAWKYRLQHRVAFSPWQPDPDAAKRLVKYSAVLSFSVIGVLFVSGLDLTIVGHYDFKQTGYYGIASQATNLMVLVIASIFGPMLPAISSLQASRTPAQIGEAAIKATRYCTLLICFVGLPLLLGAYPILKLWVGSDYAMQSTIFLRVLVVGNAIRLLGYPYSLVIVATGKLHLATIAGTAEAVVNFAASIFLVQRMGALGVAVGTVLGALVSVSVHLIVSMRLTRSTAHIERRRFVLHALLRPLCCVVPSLLLLAAEARPFDVPPSWAGAVIWASATIAIAWMVGILPVERSAAGKNVAALWQNTAHRVRPG